MEDSIKLEKFIEEERIRASMIATQLVLKQ
jgi:hypothetical protein